MTQESLEVASSVSISKYAGAIKPLFKIDCNDVPYHFGTCFGVCIGKSEYLITAKHVLSKDDENSCDSDGEIHAFSNNSLHPIASDDCITISNEQGVELDVYIIECNNDVLRNVFDSYIPESALFAGVVNKNDYWSAVGYPVTKNKRIWKTDELTQKPYAYNGYPIHWNQIDSIKYGHQAIGLSINLKKIYTSKQTEIKAPSPNRISGGPIFLVNNIKNLSETFEAKLIGLVTDKLPAGDGLIGISLISIIDAIKRQEAE